MTTVSQSNMSSSARTSTAPGVTFASPSGRAIRRVVLLAGATRQPQLRRVTKRIPAMLPLSADQTVLDRWMEQTSRLAAAYDVPQIDTRMLVDRAAPLAAMPGDIERVNFTIEQDPGEYRGTGGLLRDTAGDVDDNEWLFAISGGQILFRPLVEVFERLDAVEGDVVIAANKDGSPSGFTLIRAGVLRSIRDVGFVDLKEQALPGIAAAHRVGVAMFDEAPAMTIRERPHYLAAMRRYHRAEAGLSQTDAFEERWAPAFQVCESGAKVDAGAILHDSVVLDGGVVESGAVVVRSVVCAGAVVRRRQRMVDRIIGSAGQS